MTTQLYIPGTDESDHKKQNRSLAVIGSQTATNTDNITTNTASIATINALRASSSTFGLAEVDGTTITAAAGVLSTVNPLPAPIHNSLGADVLCNNTSNYFDGPSIAQGTSGTWWVSGSVTLLDTAATSAFRVKLWDGTTVIDSTQIQGQGANIPTTVHLSGYIVSPAANLKISASDLSATTGKIVFNSSGNSKDSTISAYRIA